MWSLGCVVAELFLGWPLYPGSSEYDQVLVLLVKLANASVLKVFLFSRFVTSVKHKDSHLNTCLTTPQKPLNFFIEIKVILTHFGDSKHQKNLKLKLRQNLRKLGNTFLIAWRTWDR